jgi:hypothetical protein
MKAVSDRNYVIRVSQSSHLKFSVKYKLNFWNMQVYENVNMKKTNEKVGKWKTKMG